MISTTDNVAVSSTVEFDVDNNFVVLESDEREGKTGIAAEEKLEGNVESGLRFFDSGIINNIDLIISLSSSERVGVANHTLITSFETSGNGEFVEDFEPVTIVEINALTTDLEFNGVDKEMTERINPAERRARD